MSVLKRMEAASKEIVLIVKPPAIGHENVLSVMVELPLFGATNVTRTVTWLENVPLKMMVHFETVGRYNQLFLLVVFIKKKFN